jgi:carboxymethylenebutenolidase
MALDLPDGVQVHGPDDGPAVLVLHPWWGISPGVLAWKDTLVAAGARVVLPDLYDGKVVDTIEEAKAMANAVDRAAAIAILEACADRLSEGGRWGALGWSMGAFVGTHLIGRGDRAPHRFVMFYGAGVTDGTDTATEAVQLHVAPGDDFFDADEEAEALEGFRAAGIRVERYEYPGLGHWFAEPGSPAYDEEGTRLATERTLAFLGLPATRG